MSYYQNNNPKRQKLVSSLILESPPGAARIENLQELRECVQKAIRVEHFTIPPYLCALYSIKEGTNVTASRIIRTVVMEEMLHMIMAANLLNAIGGAPVVNVETMIPQYPNPLPFSAGDFTVNLLKFSKEAINTFLRIEKPSPEGSSPDFDKFHSIGQFYSAIRAALIRLNEEAKSTGGIFTGDSGRQVTSEHYYGSGGKLIVVQSIDDALSVVDEIIGQGEGIDGTINDADDSFFDDDVEFAHYFRFNEIFHERYYQPGDKPHLPPSGKPLIVDWNDVYNMEPNPTMEKFSNPWLQEKVQEFNETYMDLLNNLDETCNGNPRALMKKGIPIMYKLKTQATGLMRIPSGNGNYTAGPTFEYTK